MTYETKVEYQFTMQTRIDLLIRRLKTKFKWKIFRHEIRKRNFAITYKHNKSLFQLNQCKQF